MNYYLKVQEGTFVQGLCWKNYLRKFLISERKPTCGNNVESIFEEKNMQKQKKTNCMNKLLQYAIFLINKTN